MDYLLLYIIGGIAGLCLISWVYEKYSKVRNRRRQKNLDRIAQDILADFDFTKEKGEIESIGGMYVPKTYQCPKCNGMLVLKEGIYGKFMGCNHYPDCDFFSFVQENEKTKLISVQDAHKVYEPSRCPRCGSVLVVRDGRYGKFLGCSRYPKCKYTRSI